MAAVEEQQQRPEAASPNGENAAHVANQVASKSEQKPHGNGVEKVCEKADEQNTATEAATELGADEEDAEKKQLRGDESLGAIGEDLESEDGVEDTEVKKVDSMAEEDTPVPMEVETPMNGEGEHIAESTEQIEAVKEVEKAAEVMESGDGTTTDEGAMDVDSGGVKDCAVQKNEELGGATSLPVVEVLSAVVADAATGTGGDTLVETAVAMDVDSWEKEMLTDGAKDAVGIEVEVTSSTTIVTDAASQDGEGGADAVESINEVNLEYTSHTVVTTEANELVGSGGAPLGDVEVNEVVGQIVHTLVDSVAESMNETLSIDADSVKMLSSPLMMPHLSADEAMELLEAHQGDDHEFKLDHDDGADADVETAIGKPEYQWFDGDDDDDAGVAIVSPSALDDVTDTTDDVFGFGGVVDLTGVAHNTAGNAGVESDGSADTVVLPSRSSSPKSTRSSSSCSSSSSGSASSSSSSSASSASEDENVRHASKKRAAPRSSGPRKLLNYKKQKRVRSSEPEASSRRPCKRKRKIPMPVIPKEFEVFKKPASDPILKGFYSVRNNRRACFVGDWGFSDEAFKKKEVSPFEYTSRARVLQSRRKDDKRPISGKYAGFFKLRQFNGKLVKIREDQVDLKFLPMPPSDDEEDGDEDMEDYGSDEDDGDEPAASRYTVLGKGKNGYGRFLIQGYLNPETGLLAVKRRYLE